MSDAHLRPGAVRYKNPDGSYNTYNPGHRMYSTAIMLADEYWHPDTETWKKIFPEEVADSEGGHA